MQDKIVSTVYYEGVVYIFTEYGYVYKMVKHPYGEITFHLVGRMPEQ